jgi:hypothetical protein
VQSQCKLVEPCLPQGQGFMAAMSIKSAG